MLRAQLIHPISTEATKLTTVGKVHSQKVVAYTVVPSRITSDTRGVLPQPVLKVKKYLNDVKAISVQWTQNVNMLSRPSDHHTLAINGSRLGLAFER